MKYKITYRGFKPLTIETDGDIFSPVDFKNAIERARDYFRDHGITVNGKPQIEVIHE